MRKELELDLVARAPFFWREYGDPNSCMYYGMTVGDGWYPLLANLSDQVNELDDTATAVQCKEKFYWLCVYVKAASPEVYRLVRAAEAIALETCPNCGERSASGGKEARAGGFRHGSGRLYSCEPC